ncbi:MAG: thioredoxin-disulfide reductase [Coriobacteriia bacterium]|nr:thioredoxin-disulfide reductase [Coriobacteriia bacterium]
MSSERIEIAIIGGGPAGLAAALYASRGRAKTVVFERGIPGGQIVTTEWIENYPGFPKGLSGAELGDLMTKQAEEHGAVVRTFSPVDSLTVEDSGAFTLESDGESFEADCVILATGAVPRKLGVPGEAEFTGRGVSWCATCDGALFRDKVVAVIGGGDAAVEEAMFLTKFAARVHLVHRRGEMRATKCIQERCLANPKMEFHYHRVVTEIVGENGKVAGVRLESTNGDAEEYLPLNGVFIFVGIHPMNELVAELVGTDESGYIKVDHNGLTSVPGLFAAGDVTESQLKQVITAAAQGASAAFEALRYVDENAICPL